MIEDSQGDSDMHELVTRIEQTRSRLKKNFVRSQEPAIQDLERSRTEQMARDQQLLGELLEQLRASLREKVRSEVPARTTTPAASS